jgi:hypothetical protein
MAHVAPARAKIPTENPQLPRECRTVPFAARGERVMPVPPVRPD